MKRIKQIIVAIGVSMPSFLTAMNAPVVSPEEQVQRRMAAYLEEQRKKGTAEEQAARAMQQYMVSAEERAAARMEVFSARQEMPSPAEMAKMLAEVQQEAAISDATEKKSHEDALRWENTLVTPANWKIGKLRVGWYNRDFVEAGFIGANILADVALYQQLVKRRMDAVMKAIKEDYRHFIKLIKAVNTAEEKYQKQYEEQSALGRLFTYDKKNRELLVAPLKKYINEKHILVGFWGLSKTTIFPLLFRWGFDKVSNVLESQLISYDAYKAAEVLPKLWRGEGRLPVEWQTYQRTDNGFLVKTEKTPYFSLINIARLFQWIYNPFFLTAKLGGPSQMQQIGVLNDMANLHIPKFVFSNAAQTGLEFLGLGLSAKMFDAMNSAMWGQYCAAHREELLACLESYRDAVEKLSSAEQSVAQAEQKLKEFIEKGHERNSWLPGSFLRQWWQSRAAGETRIPMWTTLGVVGILAVKAFMFWRSFGKENEEDPAQQGQPTT